MISKDKNLLQKEVELDREKIVRLRKQGASLKEISEKMNRSVYCIRETLIEELGDNYNTYNLGKEREIDTERELIVRLRKERNSIEQISHEVNLQPYYIVKILKEELGYEYDNYNLTPKRNFTRSEINKIIRLRKSYMGMQKISELCDIPYRYIKRILLKELGDEYSQYLRPNLYQNIKKRSEEKVEQIISLRNSGKSIKDISDETRFSEDFVKFILAEETNEKLKYRWESRRKGIQSEKSVLRYLSDAYDDFAEEILYLRYESLKDDHAYTNDLRKFQLLKPRCISQFFKIWKRVPKYTKYRSPDYLCPPFIFSFFKVNNIYVASSLFLQHYNFSRHMWHGSLKRIHKYFPEYMNRDRKQLIIGRINDVKSLFSLSSIFHENAKVLLGKLWKYLNNTTDDVIAGTISALSLLSIKDDTITISELCKMIGISHSSVIYQIKYKLFEALKISGFKTLNSSKDLIRIEIFEKVVGLENL